MLRIGDRAPELELLDQAGRLFRLSERQGRKNVVLFFYPKADSAVCTMEACSFRDHYQEFVEAATEVVGISSDPQDAQFRFAQKRKLPFTLLCDEEGAAIRAFGVGRWLGFMQNRVTFVIDRSGTIAAVIEGRFLAEHHVREALKTVSSF